MPEQTKKRKPSREEYGNTVKNVLFYLLLLALAFIYSYFFGGTFPYTLLYIMLALPILSLLHLVVVILCFKMSENLNERVFIKGNCATYRIVLHNASPFYIPGITLHLQMEGQSSYRNLKSVRLSLSPFAKRQFLYSLPLHFRGRYQIGIKELVVHDLMGLFHYTFRAYEPKVILVKPRICPIEYKSVPVAKISDGELTYGLREMGNDEIVDIREYAYGDSLRKIHWKLSTKLSKTMVRETRNELDNEVLLILNLSRPDKLDTEYLQKEDCLIEELVSQIHYLLSRNIPIRLCGLSDELFCVRASNMADFENLYQMLSEIKFDQDPGFENEAAYFTEQETLRNLVYLFSIPLTDALLQESCLIRNRGFELELYYLDYINEVDGGAEDTEADREEGLQTFFARYGIGNHRLKPEDLPQISHSGNTFEAGEITGSHHREVKQGDKLFEGEAKLYETGI